MADTDEIVKKRIKDAPITLTVSQFLDAYILGDSAAAGTGNILGKTLVDYIISKMVDVVCKTQAELSAALTSNTQSVILWTGSDATLLDGMSVTLGCEKIIYMHRHLLGTNCTILAPAGCSLTVYGDFYAGAHSEDGWSWKLNSQQNGTSSIRVKWLRNASEGKIICDTGTVLYERLESGLTLETNGTVGEESYITQEFWDNTNDGSTFMGDGKVFRSADDSVRGFFADKIAGSDWISKADITESDVKKIQLALKNADYFVKGNTIYGGSVIDNLNTLGRTMPFTCYGTAVGAPSTAYSWFGWHINSNTGVTAAIQMVWAFNSSSIICYERVKIANAWGAWTLRTSGGSSIAMKYDNSMDCLAATENVAWQPGSDTQWSAHGAIWKPKSDMSPIINVSTLNAILPQPISGKSYIFAAYKYMASGANELLCATDIVTMPSSSSIVSPIITRKLADFVCGQTTYFVALTNSNGALLCGKTGQNLNIQPYLAAIKTNMGVLTEAPATLTFESESSLRLFMSVTI